jgi:hypothetical protein
MTRARQRVPAAAVRDFLAALEREVVRIVAARGLERGSRLVALRVLLAAALSADLPMPEVLAQMRQVLDRDGPVSLR